MAGEGESVRSGGESVRSGGQRIVAVERRGEGVDRRAAHQEPLAGAVGHGTTGRAPPPIEAAVETVSG